MTTGEKFRHGAGRGVVVPLLLCLLATAPAASVQADSTWAVQNRLQGKSKDDKPAKAEDVSGIACAPGGFPRLCLAVDDESQGAQVVILQPGRLIAGDFIPLIDAAYQGKPLELDAEGVGYADGFFYVVGSQGRARHEDGGAKQARIDAQAAATRQVFRIGLSADAVDPETGALRHAPAVTASSALATMMQNDPVLSPFFERPLEKNGITVEGVAVRGDSLYAALRGPVIEDGKAVIARVPLAAVFDGKPGAATVFRLALGRDSLGGPRGIRDLTVAGDGFLLIAGPENDPPKRHKIAAGDYAVYAWNEGAATRRLDLPSYGKKDKPEALLVLGRDGDTLHALLLFDGAKEGEPVPVDIPAK